MRWTACCAAVCVAGAVGAAAPVWGLQVPESTAPPAAPAPAATGTAAEVLPVPEVRGGPADDYLDRAVRYGFSGAALVAKDGKVILARGYGMAERGLEGDEGTPNTLATRFDIGSVSKQFTAAAILRLQMLGKLSIDDPVSKFFDETVVLEIPEESRAITLHQLMTHNSGLHGGASFRDIDVFDRDAVVAACLAARSPFAPGTSFGYSNTNYFILAAVVERASGKPFEEAMQELVFAPAGMTETTFCGDEGAENIAHGHEDLPPPAPPGEESEALGDIGPATLRPFGWAHKGATGVLTTVGDLYRWHEALKSERVLSAEAKKTYLTPVRQQYACGWQVARDETGLMKINHGGTTVGFEAEFARWEEDGTGADRGVVILLMNSRRGLGQRLQATMAKYILAGAGEALPEPPPRPIEVEPAALERMVGIYRLTSGGSVELSIQEGKLVAAPTGQDAASLLNLPTAHLAPVLGRASARTALILKGWKTGEERDLKSYAAAIHDAVPPGSAERWTDRWSSASRGGNALESIEVLGSFVGEEGLQTAARLRYQEGEEVIRIFWRQDQVYGIGPYDVMEGIRIDHGEDSAGTAGGKRGRSPGLAVQLLPEAPGLFAAMEPEKWTVLRVRSEPAEGAAADKILLRTADQKGEGVREK